MKISLVTLFLTLLLSPGFTQKHHFVSPQGAAAQTGTRDQPFTSLAAAAAKAQPGDTIFLMPGTFEGTTRLHQIHGEPNRPIVITADDPTSLPVIDGLSAPSNDAFHPGIALDSCSWINISAIKFENCWFNVIDIRQSSYISIEFCHFTSGKYTVHPHGEMTHHILVDNCIIRHPPQVWKGWSWLEMHHGEIQYYNGALIHPRKSGGGHIMRNNELHNMFNGFRTRPANIKEDGNTEIYGNTFFNVRDNEFEPEGWAWNLHYYHNDHTNVHKLFSIDDVKGGFIYIYGNTFTQSDDPWTNYQVSGIYKYKNGPLTWPCYVFNNSYYTTGRVMKYGESSNHQMKHFNNAYQFFETKNAFRVTEWQPGYEFDHDCINQGWSDNIRKNRQEKNGLENTDPGFKHPEKGNFMLTAQSACVDAGKVLHFPELNWVQTFTGKSADIGAFEGNERVQGPPFRFIPSPEGAFYEEYPRITRHYIKDRYLILYLSAPLAEKSLHQKFRIFQLGKNIPALSATLMDQGYSLLLEFDQVVRPEETALLFDQDIAGINGLPLVSWGSTIHTWVSNRKSPKLDFASPWSDHLPQIDNVEIDHYIDRENHKLIVDMSLTPTPEIIYRGILGFSNDQDVYLDGAYPEYTEAGARYTVDISQCQKGNYELTLLIAGQLFKKKITLD